MITRINSIQIEYEIKPN